MRIVDSQVHIYERNNPGRPWIGSFRGPAEVSGEDMIAAMDKAGVDAAILVSIWSMYRYDPSYALEVRDRYPDRFIVVNSVDPDDPDLTFGLCDLGHGFPELGEVRLSEIASLRGPLGLGRG